jgi:hypothetical protein
MIEAGANAGYNAPRRHAFYFIHFIKTPPLAIDLIC